MSATPESVLVHLSPEQVTQGFYTIEDGLLVMTHDDGEPVNLNGMTFTHRMRAGDNAESIACVLTKDIRTLMIGEKVPGFTAELRYPREAVA